MQSLPSHFSILALALASLAGHAQALELTSFKVVPLTYGVNAVDFGPDGTHGKVVLGWRYNFNAHGFGVATFYLADPKRVPPPSFQTGDMLGIVTVWDDVKASKEALTVTTSGGADCVLHDFRLLISSQHKPSLLVVADRVMGETFVDENVVTFKVYALKQNTDQMSGQPAFSFDLTEQLTAKRKYCDVERAFHDEIGIGDYRVRAQ
jgi:hypothetical protein